MVIILQIGLQFLQSVVNTPVEATVTGGSVSELNACLIEVDNLEHISSLAATLMLVIVIIITVLGVRFKI
jgi:hypothetical protein